MSRAFVLQGKGATCRLISAMNAAVFFGHRKIPSQRSAAFRKLREATGCLDGSVIDIGPAWKALRSRALFLRARRGSNLLSSWLPHRTVARRSTLEMQGSPQTESQRLRLIFPRERRQQEQEPQATLHEFTDETFLKEVVNEQDKLVVLDFWSESWAACRAMKIVMQGLANAYRDEPVRVGRVDVTKNADMVKTLEIKAIPFIMVVFRGDVVLEVIGDKTFEELRGKIEPFMKLPHRAAALRLGIKLGETA